MSRGNKEREPEESGAAAAAAVLLPVTCFLSVARRVRTASPHLHPSLCCEQGSVAGFFFFFQGIETEGKRGDPLHIMSKAGTNCARRTLAHILPGRGATVKRSVPQRQPTADTHRSPSPSPGCDSRGADVTPRLAGWLAGRLGGWLGGRLAWQPRY